MQPFDWLVTFLFSSISTKYFYLKNEGEKYKMSTYVISDIHGCYEKYRQRLDKIHFSNDDTLFVLGDVVDRGPQPVKVLQDMMCRPNVVPLIGNHELMALTCLKFLTTEVTEETVAHLESDTLQILLE